MKKNYTEKQINDVFDEHKSAFYGEQEDETEVEPGDVEAAKKKSKKKKLQDETQVKSGVQPVSQIKENDEDTDLQPTMAKKKGSFKRKGQMGKPKSNPETEKFVENDESTKPVKSGDLCESCRTKIFG